MHDALTHTKQVAATTGSLQLVRTLQGTSEEAPSAPLASVMTPAHRLAHSRQRLYDHSCGLPSGCSKAFRYGVIVKWVRNQSERARLRRFYVQMWISSAMPMLLVVLISTMPQLPSRREDVKQQNSQNSSRGLLEFVLSRILEQVNDATSRP